MYKIKKDVVGYGPVSSPAEYRQFVVECLRLARQAENSGSKVLYLQMAQAWMDLCDREETRLESGGGSRAVSEAGASLMA